MQVGNGSEDRDCHARKHQGNRSLQGAQKIRAEISQAVICSHCGNHGQKEVYDPETWTFTLICMACGRDKFEEEIKEETNMSNKKCEVEGCERKAIVKGVCYTHHNVKFGKPYKPETHRQPNKELRKRGPIVQEKDSNVSNIQPHIKEVVQEKTANTLNILLDFHGYDDIFLALKETATNEMRTPEMQILWILRQLLEKGKEAA